MSGGLMSCVRENSPPLDMDVNTSGPLSLPEPRLNTTDFIDSVVHSTSQQNIMGTTPQAAHANAHLDGEGGIGRGVPAVSTPQATPPNTEQQKRRRFHPLRNLRRIFRRRTITADTTAVPIADTSSTTTLAAPPGQSSSTSEKNLRSATLSSITSVASASSPSSPLTHQQLHDAYLTQSLPKSKTSYLSLLGGVGGGGKQKSHDPSVSSEGKSKLKHKHKNQKLQQQQQQLQSKEIEQNEVDAMYGTTAQPSTAYHHQQQHHHAMAAAATTGLPMSTKSTLLSQRQSIGVAVFPGAMNRNFFADRQKLRSIGDSSQDLDSGSGNDSGTGGGLISSSAAKNSSNSGGEMSDSQRSLSEGRLIDSDYTRDGLSQSHDSVFSESATASSLSSVLKAELADVLRKRRNRPDASDEDLGLPRSPASPQRRGSAKPPSGPSSLQMKSSTPSAEPKHQGEISSLSLLSVNSIDGEDMVATSTANNSLLSIKEHSRYCRSSTMSSISTSSADILRHSAGSSISFDSKDELDLFPNDWERLSHSAAKHKMAIRPNKKKGGPSRQHRRTLQTSIPEANEDLGKLYNKKLLDIKGLDTNTKTRSLPPGGNTSKLMEEHLISLSVVTKNVSTAVKDTSEIATTYSNSATAAASAMAPILPSKPTTTNNQTTSSAAIFETREASSSDKENLSKPVVTNEDESNDTGFLRRLINRNSKRSIGRATAGDEETDAGLDVKQNKPKKLHVSPIESKKMSNTSITQDVTNSEFSYISSKKEKQLDIKAENRIKPLHGSVKPPCAAIVVTQSTKEYSKSEELAPTKPKSGPAARQRYMPQNISNENVHKTSEDLMLTTSRESILSAASDCESFKSISMIQEITKQQSSSPAGSSPTKPDHHFEKKPKIVGLSAFQQKISRSTDSFVRANSCSNHNSMNSLDQVGEEAELCSPVKAQIYEQKSRKSVEKAKSFRSYGEEKISAALMHNNMPSLPDLSLNLRIPYQSKNFVLHEREQVAKERKEEVKTRPLTLTKPLVATKVIASPVGCGPSHLISPTAIYNREFAELESRVEDSNRSSFISVLRKSSHDTAVQTSITNLTPEKVRPSVLALKKEKSLSEDNVLNSPSTSEVTLRERSLYKQKMMYSSGNIEPVKDFERKSAPQPISLAGNGLRSNSTRRSSTSVTESLEADSGSKVPEFMKIQLNRVDPMRLSHSHVVLAKNVKQSPPINLALQSREHSPEKDDYFKRLSSESVDINERSSPEMEKRQFPILYHEAVNRSPKLCIGLPPKSPIKKTSGSMIGLPATPTTPPTPTINEYSGRHEPETYFKLPEPEKDANGNSDNNSLSLQERRRLFMSEEKNAKERRMEETKNERKMSINEEPSRKTLIKSESLEQRETSPTDNCVILRKKSFASITSHLSMNCSNSSSCGSSTCTDPTPELMKVFARRSLKVKDEDLDRMMATPCITNNNSNCTISAPQTVKKFNSNSNSSSISSTSSSNPSVDSDKENHSASEEKLDKFNNKDSNQLITITKTTSVQTPSRHQVNGNDNSIHTQRSSFTDFRHLPAKLNGTGLTLNNSINNNNNNNNYNNNNNSSVNGNLSFLPPIKTTGFRPVSMERNSNNNIANDVVQTSPARSTTLERPSSIKMMGDLMATSPMRNENSAKDRATTATTTNTAKTQTNITKTFERSATVSEFKGIHQRRAEWEQRAKEALK